MESNRLDVERLKNYHVNCPHPLEDSHLSNNYLRSHQETAVKRKLPLDTPSTTHGITRTHQKINSIAQSHTNSNYPKSDSTPK